MKLIFIVAATLFSSPIIAATAAQAPKYPYQLSPGYNAPARIHPWSSFNTYVTGSYIFWQPREEHLALGVTSSSLSPQPLPLDGSVIEMPFEYQSGFKAGLGIFFQRDNWEAYAGFTRLIGSTQESRTSVPTQTIVPLWGNPNNVLPSMIPPVVVGGTQGSWSLDLNTLDTYLARNCYLGTNLTLRPFFGIRNAWIDQSYRIQYDTYTAIPGAGGTTFSAFSNYGIDAHTNSWGIGPEVGLGTEWFLTCQTRFLGFLEADILFTRYHNKYQEQNAATPSILAVNISEGPVKYLRPHFNLDLGIAWGSYFSRNSFHFDLGVLYSAHVYWNQNMFIDFLDTGGDLFVHGLTVDARFDF